MCLKLPTYLGEAIQLLLSGLMLLAGIAIVAARPAADEHDYLVVFPPWTSQAEATAAAMAAGTSIIALPGVRFAAAVHSNIAGYPDLAREQGALLVLSSRLAAGCASRRVGSGGRV